MNRQEAKKLLPIIQAFAEGKIVQFKNAFGNWIDCCDGLLFNYPPKDYRIKPEPKYRPFANKYECWNEMLKHQPFGWISFIDGEKIFENIVMISRRGVILDLNDINESFENCFKGMTFADGTPFGIKEYCEL